MHDPQPHDIKAARDWRRRQGWRMTPINDLETEAKARTDGHLTIFRFTTGWKAMLGTPDLDSGYGREQVFSLPSFDALDEAIKWALSTQPQEHLLLEAIEKGGE